MARTFRGKGSSIELGNWELRIILLVCGDGRLDFELNSLVNNWLLMIGIVLLLLFNLINEFGPAFGQYLRSTYFISVLSISPLKTILDIGTQRKMTHLLTTISPFPIYTG